MHNIRIAQPKLVGITGYKGCGKDTVAEHLCEIYGFRSFAFADSVKQALVTIFDVDRSIFYDPAHKEVPHPALFGHTPRYAMQTLGTEWGQDCMSPGMWVDLLFRKVSAARERGEHSIVVSDVRFDTEAQAVRDHGGVVWRINRPSTIYSTGDEHRSEAGVSPELIDTVINNNLDKRMLFTQVGVAIANIDRNPGRPNNGTSI